jgi:LysR family transcriptional regulator, glycine cleavage system transcriptional activator
MPTRAGTELFAEASLVLDRLAAVSQPLHEPMPATPVLRVSASPTFAMRSLIPRLPELQRDHPGVELRIFSASTPAEQFRMDVDAVVSGPGWHSGWVGTRFLGEAQLPVLSPNLMEKVPLKTAADLERHTFAARRDIALGVAAMARYRQCSRSGAGARWAEAAFAAR